MGLLLCFSLLLSACENDDDLDEAQPSPSEAQQPEPEPADERGFLLPSAVKPGKAPERPDRPRFRDDSDALHAIFMHGARARSSEMGHEAYRPELDQDFMDEQARLWLRLFRDVQMRYADGLAARPEAVWEEGDWRAHGDVVLRDQVWGSYLYHMHHRESWFEDGDVRDAITRMALPLLTGITRHVMDEHYRDGVFHLGDPEETVSADSMMDGLAVFTTLSYAWVRWQKPGGADDMGGLSEERLRGWLGRGPEELLDIASAAAEQLDARWDEDRGFYDFGDQTWSLATVGSLMRGHKGLYEVLYLFGGDEEREQAELLFRRAVRVLEQVLPLARDWGLPAQVTFTESGAEAASGEVDVAAHWDLIAHLVAGFSFDREREGTARMMRRLKPDLADELAVFVDQQILEALEWQMPEGIVVARLDYEDGTVLDQRHYIRAISRFMVGAGEGYGGSELFASPADWDGDQEDNTRRLYDSLYRHGEFLRSEFLELAD